MKFFLMKMGRPCVENQKVWWREELWDLGGVSKLEE
jgi:hypothetical protein